MHLLQQHRPARYRLHDLIRAYAVLACAQEEPEADRQAALTRLFDYYARAASGAMDVLYPHEVNHRPRAATEPAIEPAYGPAPADEPAAAAWLDAELANLLTAAVHGQPVHTLHLSTTLHRHLRTRAHYAEAENLHTHAARAARRGGDRAGELQALNCLGHIRRMRDQHDPVVFERALAIAVEIGDGFGEFNAVNALGVVQRLQGRYDAAASNFGRSMGIARQIGHRSGELHALVGLGVAHRERGRYSDAACCYRRALDIAGEIGDRNGQLEALLGLGHVQHATGHPGEARTRHAQALDVARVLNQPEDEARAHHGLARACRALDELDRAAEHWRDAEAILDRLGLAGVEEVSADDIRSQLGTLRATT